MVDLLLILIDDIGHFLDLFSVGANLLSEARDPILKDDAFLTFLEFNEGLLFVNSLSLLPFLWLSLVNLVL